MAIIELLKSIIDETSKTGDIFVCKPFNAYFIVIGMSLYMINFKDKCLEECTAEYIMGFMNDELLFEKVGENE